MKKINKHGFTLIELIVVITIIAILATLGIWALQKYLSDARDTKRISDITEIEKALVTSNSKWYKPVSLGQIADEFKEYPTDPDNGYGYQYNVNSKGASSRYRNTSWKGFVVCTNRPLEGFSSQDGDLLPDYLDDVEIDDRSRFISWKLRNTVSWTRTDIGMNEVMWYYCSWETDDFSSLVAWGWDNSHGTANCDVNILNPDLDDSEKWAACKIIFNQDYTAQAIWDSPAPGTPIDLPEWFVN